MQRTRSVFLRSTLVAAVLWLISVSAAWADSGAVLVTGKVDVKKRTVIAAAVNGALRQAKWPLIDSPFDEKDVIKIEGCMRADAPWPCLDPIVTPKDVSRFVLVDVTSDKAGSVKMSAQLAKAGDDGSGIEEQYCSPCNDTALAQAATDLTNRLLASNAARTGKTFIQITSDPPGAAVTLDGRQVGPAGRKFPAAQGRHRVLLQLSGYQEADMQLDVVEGETKLVELKLEPLTKAPFVPVEPSPPPRLLQWGLIGGGSAALVIGSLVSWYADAPGPDEPRNSQYYYNGPALVVAGAGGVAAVVGAIWLLRTPKTLSKPTVTVGHDGVQAGWSFSF